MKFPADNSVGYYCEYIYLHDQVSFIFECLLLVSVPSLLLIASMFPILLNNLIVHLFNVGKIFNHSVAAL
jgi:hypothetical protein